jgi:hypothetical protein
MSGFSTYISQKIIAATLANTPFSVAATYLALFIADPTDNNITTNEVSGAWYARKATGTWTAPTGTGNSSTNNAQIQFNAITGSGVTVSHWGIYDALTGGNLIYSDTIGTAKTFGIGDVPTVAANANTITVD